MRKRTILFWLAVACLILGGLLAAVFTAVRFTGYLLLCACVVLLLFAALDKLAEKQRWAQWISRALLVLLAVGVLFFAAMEAWVISWAHTDREREVSAVVVLGAGVNGTVPSLSLQKRLEAARDYLAEKPDIPIVVTGSQGPGEEISEARCMADWLIASGIEESRILLEEQADNTEENIEYSLALLADNGVDTTDNIAVVTSDYHLCRAARYWGLPSMVPVAAEMPAQFWPLTVNYFIREAFAMAALLAFS